MDRMCGKPGVRNVDPDAGVGAKIVDVPLRTIGVRIVAKVGKEEDWLVVVCSERDLVHRPEKVS
jgi:hypothetical protein